MSANQNVPNNVFRRLSALLLTVLTAVLASCSTDFDVNAEYKAIPVVFGYLDPSQTMQYVRIQRTYQNRNGEDARQIARNNRDSSEFAPGTLDVTLWQVIDDRNQRFVGRYQAVTNSGKDTNGTFYSPDHTVYQLPTPANTLVAGQNYRLRIKNIRTGDSTVQAVTTIVGAFDINLPTNDPNLSPQDTLSRKTFFITPRNSNSSFNIQYWPNCYAKLTAMQMRIKYREVLTNGTSVDRDVWYTQALKNVEPRLFTTCGRQGQPTTIAIAAAPIFQLLIDSIPPADNTISQRVFLGIDCHFSAASQQIVDYQNVNAQFQPITQSVPTYSNISNGLGMFGSIRSEVVTARFQPLLPNEMNEAGPTGQPVYPQLAALKFRVRN